MPVSRITSAVVCFAISASVVFGIAPANAAPTAGCAVQTECIQATHRSGQAFITWPEDGAVTGEKYAVYRAGSAINESNIDQATKVATVSEGSGVFTNEVSSGNPYQDNYIIEDLGSELPNGVGLFVHTTHETGPAEEYYAVAEVINDVRQPLEAELTLDSSVTESKAEPEPVRVWTNGVKTLYTHWMDYAQWNPKFEGYAYNFWVGVPSQGNESQLPLQMHLHAWGESWQRNWTSGDSSGSGSPYNWQTVWIEPDDNRNTWWYGFGDDVSRGQAPNPATTTIVNYTEKRLEYYFDWITGPNSPYKIDTNRMYIYGGSMGGSGALSFGLRHPELFAGVYSLLGMTNEQESTWGRSGLDGLWGTVEQNIITNDGVGVHDRLNMQQYLLDHRGELPYTVSYHGREDTTIEWTTQGLPWTDVRVEALVAGPIMWADCDHSSCFDIYTGNIFPNWVMTEYGLKKNESYIAFSNGVPDVGETGELDDDPRGSVPECRGSNPSYAWGYIGNSVEWASSANQFMGISAPVDTGTQYKTAIRVRSDLCNLPDNGTVTAAIMRTQGFKPVAGSTINWENRNSADELLQSGTATLDSYGRVVIPGLEVSKAGSFLTLTESPGEDPKPIPVLAPAALDFGSLTVGTTSNTPLQITVTNNGSANFDISSVTISGSDRSDFSLTSDSCTGTGIAPGTGSCTVEVSFSPTTAGNKQAELEITDSAGPAQKVTLAGVGVADADPDPDPEPDPEPSPDPIYRPAPTDPIAPITPLPDDPDSDDDATPPTVDDFKAQKKLLRASRLGRKKYTRIAFKFNLSEPATTRITIRKDRRCKRSKQGKKSCNKSRVIARYTVKGTEDQNIARLKIKTRLLTPGRYTAYASAEAEGETGDNKSPTARTRFRVAR